MEKTTFTLMHSEKPLKIALSEAVNDRNRSFCLCEAVNNRNRSFSSWLIRAPNDIIGKKKYIKIK